MALVSGPTVGNAISDPENAVAKLVASGQRQQRSREEFVPAVPQPARQAGRSFGRSRHVRPTGARKCQTGRRPGCLRKRTWARSSPRKELDRQNRIVGLQTELEAYREIAKLRGPRAEKERQDRIAKAKAAIADNDKKLMERMPKFEASQKKKTRWYPLEALEMGATYRARFARQADGSIFVDGDKAQGAYRIVAPLPLDKITGIRLDALADDRLAKRGPGRSPDGNFVVTEFAAHLLAAPGPMKLVRSWDFSGTDDGWQNEPGAKIVADSGMRHLFGSGKSAGMKTALKEPAGAYLLEVVTGIRSGSHVYGAMDDGQPGRSSKTLARLAARYLPAAAASTATPIAIFADAELTGFANLGRR